MATYKLIQDIEAEDHILGPLTLRQFIFALVAVFAYYISFLMIAKLNFPFGLIITLPPALFFTFFAFPFGRDQPTEIWALAKIRYLLKPRRRVWDQSGMKDLVTITVPKRIEPVRTDGLSQTEVRSRLRALATTIDSRGWATKSSNLSAYAVPNPLAATPTDRLIDMNSLPQQVPIVDIQASDDIMDAGSNPIAQQFDHMISQAEQAHRQQISQQLNGMTNASQQAEQPPSYWFMNQPKAPSELKPGETMFDSAQVVMPGTQPDTKPTDASEKATAKKLKSRKKVSASNSRMRTLKPASKEKPKKPDTGQSVSSSPSSVTATPDPAILSLANNDDLNVATLARQAQKAKGDDETDKDEVVISLH